MKKISLVRSAAMPPDGVHEVNLPMELIGVLPQMRGRMSQNGLEDLVESIKTTRQEHPGAVLALNKAGAERYLEDINRMWGTSYTTEEFELVSLEEKMDSYFLFLVAGHRRYRAVGLAKLPLFYCRVYFEKSLLEALLMQYHENFHEQVPPDSEARFITLYWRNAKVANASLTLTHFAKSISRKPEYVRRCVRFTVLPIKVQELVLPSEEYKKGIAFALLCELARLQEARLAKGKGYSEEDLLRLSYVLVTQYRTVKKASAWVSEQIKVLNGQQDMFGLSIVDVVDGARKSVGTGLEHTLREGDEHFRRVARLHERGNIKKVASGAAARAVERTLRIASELAPSIVEGVRNARGASKAREALKKVAD